MRRRYLLPGFCSRWQQSFYWVLSLVLSVFAMPLESQQTLRDEQFRPQVHFSPEHNWTNDPNGLVYFDDEYHLFFQYNPFGHTWGHMSWGHAVSKDLLHWQELPVAIPEAKNEMIFTGSVVVDEHNTSGLCDGGKACLVAVYTGHRREGDSQREVQNITSSQDRGRTWQTYKGNPVLDLKLSDFRDPSVSWSSEANAWVMAVSLPNEHKVLFYTSPDLKQWKATGTFGPAGATGGQWECPSLVHVSTVDGSQSMWALKVGLNPGALQGGSGEQYFLGAFDGRQFVPSSAAGSHGWSDYGKDSYCAINFNHLRPGEEPVLIGWMNNWQYANKLPTAPWRGQMTIPRRLTMLHDAAGISLVQTPILAPLRVGPGTALHANLRGDKTSIDLLKSEAPLEAQLTFMPGDAELVGVRIYSDDTHWTETGFDQKKHVVYVDRTHAGVDVAPGFNMRTEAPVVSNRAYDLRLILDRSSIEAFAQAGTIAMTNLIFPPDKSARLILFRSGGKASRVTGRFWKLRSIWRP